MMYWYALYQTYREFNIVTTHLEIAHVVGLDPIKIRTACALFCEFYTGYKPVLNDWSIMDLVIFYANKAQVIVTPTIIERVKNSKDIFVNKKTHLVALGFLFTEYKDVDWYIISHVNQKLITQYRSLVVKAK